MKVKKDTLSSSW